MLTREVLEGKARELGVAPDVLEKVHRLLAILRRLRAEEGVAGRCALKGGTALNLFWLPMPLLCWKRRQVRQHLWLPPVPEDS